MTDLGLKPRQIKKVAVLGGGLMGSGIATALVLSNIPVVLKEVNAGFLQQGINRISGMLFSNLPYFVLDFGISIFIVSFIFPLHISLLSAFVLHYCLLILLIVFVLYCLTCDQFLRLSQQTLRVV